MSGLIRGPQAVEPEGPQARRMLRRRTSSPAFGLRMESGQCGPLSGWLGSAAAASVQGKNPAGVPWAAWHRVGGLDAIGKHVRAPRPPCAAPFAALRVGAVQDQLAVEGGAVTRDVEALLRAALNLTHLLHNHLGAGRGARMIINSGRRGNGQSHQGLAATPPRHPIGCSRPATPTRALPPAPPVLGSCLGRAASPCIHSTLRGGGPGWGEVWLGRRTSRRHQEVHMHAGLEGASHLHSPGPDGCSFL